MNGPATGLTLTEAQHVVLENAEVLGTEEVGLRQAVGRVLRQDINAGIDLPTADISSVDGYCIDAGDTATASPETPAVLIVKSTIGAGRAARLRLQAGGCALIMTGAAMPQGANAVVSLEDARVEAQSLIISRPIPEGAQVQVAGSLVCAGDMILEAGQRLTPPMIGMVACLFGMSVVVGQRPRVGLLATGDELVPWSHEVVPGTLRSSNSAMLAGFLDGLGCEVLDLGICGDKAADLCSCLDAARDCQAVITTGGTSTGRFDMVPKALRAAGVRTIFRGMASHPGKHMMFAKDRHRLLFALPGRPAACLVLFHVLVRPALLKMQGHGHPEPFSVRARLARPVEGGSGLAALMPARLGVDLRVEPLRSLGPGDLKALARANCIISLQADCDSRDAGRYVEVFPLDGC